MAPLRRTTASLRYVVARYAAYPQVIWCLCNEWEAAGHAGNRQTRDDFNRMGTLVHKADPWLSNGALRRPLSIHNQSINFQFFDVAWPTHVIIQYACPWAGKPTLGDKEGNDSVLTNLGHNMPVVNDEYGYIKNVPLMNRTRMRQEIWGIATAGGFGSHGDFRVTPDGMGNVEITGEWYDAPEYGDLKHLIDLLTTKGIEYWKMASHNGLVTSGQRMCVLAEPGRQYVIYAAVGGDFSIKLAKGKYQAFRYDPRTGEETSLGTIAGGGTHSFTLPDDRDWVIYLMPAAGAAD